MQHVHLHQFVYLCLCVQELALNFIFAVLCSGTRPTQEVEQCSTAFDWQHFFGEAGSSAIDFVFQHKSGLCLLVPVPSFTHFPSLSVLALGAAQKGAQESQ